MGKLRACIVSCNKEMSFDKCLLAQNLLILPCNSSWHTRIDSLDLFEFCYVFSLSVWFGETMLNSQAGGKPMTLPLPAKSLGLRCQRLSCATPYWEASFLHWWGDALLTFDELVVKLSILLLLLCLYSSHSYINYNNYDIP